MAVAITRLSRPHRLPVLDQRYEPGVLIVGKYRLEAELGEGGMGTVWLARNETLDAPVALKLIRSGMEREETVERLLLEAHVEAKLKHPNIVRVFDFGRTDFGDAFIVMEVLDGISLGELLKQRGRLSAIEAVQLVLPVIGALCHAHENGVVHRDLKPDNIFLDRGGLHAGTKLLDFGIAKLTGDDCDHFAEAGQLVGSPAYMAPEQAEGSENVDHRADIWAVCVVLYEAISGKQAFPGEGDVLLRRVIDDEVPALTETGARETLLSGILARGLQKDPSRRFQSMRELGTALAQWLCDRGESEDLDGNRISHRWEVTKVAAEAERGPRRAPRMVAAYALAIAMLLAPSRSEIEPAVSAGTASAQRAPVVDQSSIRLAQAAPIDRPVPNASWVPAEAVPPSPEARDRSHSRRSTRRLIETDLGLKAPY